MRKLLNLDRRICLQPRWTVDHNMCQESCDANKITEITHHCSFSVHYKQQCTWSLIINVWTTWSKYLPAPIDKIGAHREHIWPTMHTKRIVDRNRAAPLLHTNHHTQIMQYLLIMVRFALSTMKWQWQSDHTQVSTKPHTWYGKIGFVYRSVFRSWLFVDDSRYTDTETTNV